MASLKVGSRLAYQAAVRGAATPVGLWASRSAQTVIKCRKLHEDAGAQAIVIAGTELSLVLREGEKTFPLVDCAKAHVEAIIERAVGAT